MFRLLYLDAFKFQIFFVFINNNVLYKHSFIIFYDQFEGIMFAKLFGRVKLGTIKLFKRDKGYGFITNEGGDIFFHINDCEGISEAQLSPGAQVEYQITTDPKNNKKRASKIKVVS